MVIKNVNYYLFLLNSGNLFKSDFSILNERINFLGNRIWFTSEYYHIYPSILFSQHSVLLYPFLLISWDNLSYLFILSLFNRFFSSLLRFHFHSLSIFHFIFYAKVSPFLPFPFVLLFSINFSFSTQKLPNTISFSLFNSSLQILFSLSPSFPRSLLSF